MRQAEFARHIDVSPATVSMLLNGRREIGLKVARRLAAAGRRKVTWWINANLADRIAEMERMWRKLPINGRN